MTVLQESNNTIIAEVYVREQVRRKKNKKDTPTSQNNSESILGSRNLIDSIR